MPRLSGFLFVTAWWFPLDKQTMRGDSISVFPTSLEMMIAREPPEKGFRRSHSKRHIPFVSLFNCTVGYIPFVPYFWYYIYILYIYIYIDILWNVFFYDNNIFSIFTMGLSHFYKPVIFSKKHRSHRPTALLAEDWGAARQPGHPAPLRLGFGNGDRAFFPPFPVLLQ